MDLDIIYNEDCFEGIAKLPDKSIDLVITDPPYWHKKTMYILKQYETDSTFGKSELYRYDKDMMGNMSTFDDKCIDRFLNVLLPKMKIMNAYIFCSESQVPYYCMWAENNGLKFAILVWEKPLSIIAKNRYSQNLEFIVRIYDYGTALNNLPYNDYYSRVKKNVPVGGNDKLHPTQKPVDLIQEFIRLNSKEGDVVLDAFMGSGTTAIACIREHRRYIGYELSEEYFDTAVKRIDAEQRQLTLF